MVHMGLTTSWRRGKVVHCLVYCAQRQNCSRVGHDERSIFSIAEASFESCGHQPCGPVLRRTVCLWRRRAGRDCRGRGLAGNRGSRGPRCRRCCSRTGRYKVGLRDCRSVTSILRLFAKRAWTAGGYGGGGCVEWHCEIVARWRCRRAGDQFERCRSGDPQRDHPVRSQGRSRWHDGLLATEPDRSGRYVDTVRQINKIVNDRAATG